jgi:hypothetical protein
MFKIKPKATFPFKATLHAPGEGRQICTFEGRHFGQEELQNVLEGASNDNDITKAVVCGWTRKDFDADFSDENLAEMLAAYPGLGSQIAKAYLAELAGAPQLKNSPPPAATGH